ncbi:S-layer homology domain-containing protein [Gorillibacterium timonense]|uniref:S-layer homology domain-containing protein n=1 Tax=Gorillibacterium timonense TaxID=1689269 RepID=UPI00131A784F|nr:S-layer homology domain-containing protein [Gorillibacterium timonense]
MKIRSKVATILMTVFLLVGTMPFAAGVEAADSTTVKQRTDYSASGQGLVWFETDTNGNRQLLYQNGTSGSPQAVTNSTSAKDAPYLSGDFVVWADKGDHPAASVNWDIYLADTRTGIHKKLNSTTGEYGNPTVDGVGVVWSDRSGYGRMVYHELATDKETDVGEGRFPILNNGVIVYKNARDGGLSLLDLSSGARRSLVSLGNSNYVDWFVFNGTDVLWKQKNGLGESKYVLINSQDPAAEPRDLTSLSAKSVEYAFMSIGDTQAVFLDSDSGSAVLRGVNLTNGTIYSVPVPSTIGSWIGFSGDRLLYSLSDQSIHSLDLAKGETGGNGSDNGGSTGGSNGGGNAGNGDGGTSGGSTGGNPTGSTEGTRIGPDGGTIESADGRARLEIAPETFQANTTISLLKNQSSTAIPHDDKGRVLTRGSSDWRVATDAAFRKAALLELKYDSEDVLSTGKEKLGIYRFDSHNSYWIYVGGSTGAHEGYVRSDIRESGVYAVMLRNLNFADVTKGFWAEEPIGVLAARGVLEGDETGRFAPNAAVTREEFTKMLAVAIGLEPLSSGHPTFRDVPANRWSSGWIEAASAVGIVQGDNGRFQPASAITREQMVTMLMRAKAYAEQRANNSNKNPAESAVRPKSELSSYTDGFKVSGWAEAAMLEALQQELLNGDNGKLYPQRTANRAEAAAVIYRLLGKLGLL